MEELCGEVQFRIIEDDGAIQTILYENEPYKGNPTEVLAYIGIPEHSEGTVPGMVCVHGGGGTAFRQWVELWVARGYAAIAMDLSGRDGEKNRLPNGGPEQDHEAKFNTSVEWGDLWTYHAVAAVLRAHTILRGLQQVDEERTGITGISWGGYTTCIAAGVDPRFACAIPVYGCGFLQDNSAADWMQVFAKMTGEERKRWHDLCDPSMYVGNTNAPLLFVTGTNDFAYPLDSLEKTCALPQGNVSRCVRIRMGHGHEHGWAPPEIGWFADQHLNGGTPLHILQPTVVEEDMVRAGFSTQTPITKSRLAYTTDQGTWQERYWQDIPATIGDQVVEASLPAGCTACFLTIEDERGATLSSSMVQPES